MIIVSLVEVLDKLQRHDLVLDPSGFLTVFISPMFRTFSEIDKQLYKPLPGLINLVGLSN